MRATRLIAALLTLSLWASSCALRARPAPVEPTRKQMTQLWKDPGDSAARDLFGGPGGLASAPDPASGYTVVGVAAVVTVEGGTCTAAGLTIGGVTAPPVHATAAADALVGGDGSADAIAAAAGRVPESIPSALSDAYASGEYRTHLATVLTRRALSTAFERAA